MYSDGRDWPGRGVRAFIGAFSLIGMVVIWACTFVETHQTVHLKWIHVIVYKLYFHDVNSKMKKKINQDRVRKAVPSLRSKERRRDDK